jgi:hypothetical protein
MQYKFSEELRTRLIAYFKANHALDVLSETADEWLDSLANLYLSFSDMNKN